MEAIKRTELSHFYLDHFRRQVYPFWEKAMDEEYGGCYTCFDNEGERLLSTDKFTWSQGRMLWVLSNLCMRDILSPEQKQQAEKWARQTAEFLMAHCLLPNGNCTFIMDRRGNPKGDGELLDTSVYADCFAVIGTAAYGQLSGREDALRFARDLFVRVEERIASGSYLTDPYPEPKGYRAHGIPMILTNTARTLSDALASVGDGEAERFSEIAQAHARDILDHFVDENNVIHEFIRSGAEGEEAFDCQSLIGRYMNPGHTIEDVWFMMSEWERAGDRKAAEKTLDILERALQNGWDKEYGGILLFRDMTGEDPQGSGKGFERDPMYRKVTSDWQSKLWWVHSETLYSTLMGWLKYQRPVCREFYEKVSDYVFSTFPAEEEGKEWLQIRDREGRPESKIVALPVKDPFHIMRNLIMILDLLHEIEQRGNT